MSKEALSGGNLIFIHLAAVSLLHLSELFQQKKPNQSLLQRCQRKPHGRYLIFIHLVVVSGLLLSGLFPAVAVTCVVVGAATALTTAAAA